uniref:Battenin n=1 Tax=Rhabditophanes sp. KR3021 TaxID=114890 RepID=A0AC35UG21_9BILA
MTSKWNSPKFLFWRNIVFFWIAGLANNYAYVIMLSAAEDILAKQDHTAIKADEACSPVLLKRKCSATAVGFILLADIVPTFCIKIIWPFLKFAERIPYGTRHAMIIASQVLAYMLVAFSTSDVMSYAGVIFAALGSGFGEINFLALGSFYPKSTVSAWSSGTGAAGLIGSLSYAGLTDAGLSPSAACLVMLIIPIIFSIAYWFILAKPPSLHQVTLSNISTWLVPKDSTKSYNNSIESSTTYDQKTMLQRNLSFKDKIKVTVPLLKFMIPLSLVYFFEYTINQGAMSLIVFDCSHGFNLSKASQYRWFQALYQLGVFIARSSLVILTLPVWSLYLLPVIQMANLAFFINEAIFEFVPHIAILMAIIIFEGLLGGLSYVNTFDKIHKLSADDVREFAMSIGTLATNMPYYEGGPIEFGANERPKLNEAAEKKRSDEDAKKKRLDE